MRKLLETVYNIYKIEELRDRVVLTLSLLLVYRLGAQVVLPGIDPIQLSELSERTDGGGLLGILNAFTGGAFANASDICFGDYALHICINCCPANGNSSSIPSKTSKRG